MRITHKWLQGIRVDANREFSDDMTRGLFVRVSPTGRKAFEVRYKDGSKRRRRTIGRYPDMSLAQAREEARQLVGSGVHRGDVRGSRLMFRDLAQRWMSEHCERRCRPLTIVARRCTLNRHLLPAFGDIPADALSRAQVKALAYGLADEMPTRANSLVELVSTIYNWALAEELVDRNPAARIRPPGITRPRDRVLSDAELAAIYRAFGAETTVVGIYLQIVLLTGSRPGELRSARWSDLDGHWLHRSADEMKAGNKHAFYLAPRAKRLVDFLATIAPHPTYIFPGKAGRSHMRTYQKTADRIRRQLGLPHWTPHDLRRTFRTRGRQIGIPVDALEAVMAHSRGLITRTYEADLPYPEIQDALVRWDAHITQILDEAP
ncbi:MAG: tyrosine-type recombinase/integrase [Acidobacteriota bacterium]